MAAVLQAVAAQVAERYGGAPGAITIAHPANWGQYKIELLRQAAQLAGLGRARFLTEPEASAIHYAAGERVQAGDVVAVYDLGGGTFDAAVLRRRADGFEILGEPQGIERLGGIDFDEAVFSHVRATVSESLAGLDHSDPTVRAAVTHLRGECVSAKESLSDDSETSIPVMLPGLQTQVRLTRTELEDAIRPALRETVDSLRRAVESAGLAPADLVAVVLAGGSSRIPLVNELVGELGRSSLAMPTPSTPSRSAPPTSLRPSPPMRPRRPPFVVATRGRRHRRPARDVARRRVRLRSPARRRERRRWRRRKRRG